MARARRRTLLPLDTWASKIGLDPRHFNQVISTAVPNTSCSKVWKQYAWQEAGQISREDVANAIYQAERVLERELHFKLLPDWEVDERLEVNQPAIVEVLNIGLLDARGFPMSVTLNKGQFISGGIEGKTLIEAAAGVTYTDADGDGYFETATVTVATTVTNPEEIAVYFPGEDGSDRWEVKPLQNPLNRERSVTIAGGVATIIMAREQLVDPDLWSANNPTAVDGEDNASFLSTVDVFRHFNDIAQQVTLMWTPHGSFCDCGSSTCVTCAHSLQAGCLLAKDYRKSEVRYQPANFDATAQTFSAAAPAVGRNPNNVRAWYYAGLRDMSADAPNLEMDDMWATVVAHLSLTFLQRPLCACDNVEALATMMREDLAAEVAVDAGSASFQLNDEQLGNPFGTQRGAVMAWRQIRENTIGQAVRL